MTDGDPRHLVSVPHNAAPNDMRRVLMAMYVHRKRHERVGAALRVIRSRSEWVADRHRIDARAILDGPGDLIWSKTSWLDPEETPAPWFGLVVNVGAAVLHAHQLDKASLTVHPASVDDGFSVPWLTMEGGSGLDPRIAEQLTAWLAANDDTDTDTKGE